MRGRTWLLFAALMMVLAAVLTTLGDSAPAPAPIVEAIEFPRELRPYEVQRVVSRQRASVAAPPSPTARDPFLLAFPTGQAQTAVVLEANAVRHSPIGGLLTACLNQRMHRGLKRMREQWGIDAFEGLDRVAFTSTAAVVSGDFSDARWEKVFGSAARQRYGTDGEIYSQPPRVVSLPDGGTAESGGMAVGTWRGSLLVWADTVEEVERAIDRIEGRIAVAAPALSEAQTYGDLYGVVSGEDLRRFVPAQYGGLLDKLRESGAQLEVHVDAQNDVALSAHVRDGNASQVADLGKTLGGALSLARAKAKLEGDVRMASFLEFARVQSVGESLRIELAVPREFLEEQLSFCRPEAVKEGPF